MTSRFRVGRARRAVEALELREKGLTFREIGARMGVSRPRAFQLVSEELARVNARRAEQAAEITRLELLRLDALHRVAWKKAMRGHLPSIDRVLGIMARRARLLGLDAGGSRGEVTVQNVNVGVVMTDRERADAFAALLARVGDGSGGPNPEGKASGARPLRLHHAG